MSARADVWGSEFSGIHVVCLLLGIVAAVNRPTDPFLALGALCIMAVLIAVHRKFWLEMEMLNPTANLFLVVVWHLATSFMIGFVASAATIRFR